MKICGRAKVEAPCFLFLKVLSYKLQSNDMIDGPRKAGNNFKYLSLGCVHWADTMLGERQ